MALSIVNSPIGGGVRSLPALKSSLISRKGFPSSSQNSSNRSSGNIIVRDKRRPTSVHCSAPLTDFTNGSPSAADIAEALSSNLTWAAGHKPHNAFPEDFIFGAATSAFQVEGATRDGGKGPSIWDTFCEKYPEKIADRRGGEPGAGSYYRYKEDVQLVADIGLNAYRFSISWPRIFPKGRGTPNEEGVKYYHKLIDELIRRGIEPYVTIFHWDVPQALEDEYGGFLSRKIIEDYKNYAQFLFKEYGRKVKHWITFNEPQMFIIRGYGSGSFAPGHCTPDLQIGPYSFVCPAGDSIREPYIVGHNILLSHAEAVKIYKEQFLAGSGDQGEIGITLVTAWYEPYDDSCLTKEAQKRALDFNLGWFVDPLKFGDYPLSMRALVGDRLPLFTEEESENLARHKTDFIGINYYTARYVKHVPFNPNFKPKIFTEDGRYDTLTHKGNIPIGPAEPNSWVNVYPKGLKKLLLFIRDRYDNIPVYITENGVLQYNKEQEKLAAAGVDLPAPIEDIYRTAYLIAHLQELEDAISNGVNVKGYFVWSLLDCFEWNDGYTARFGLAHIDYTNIESPDLTRRVKKSALWLRGFLADNIKKHPKPIVYDVVPTKEAQSSVIKV